MATLDPGKWYLVVECRNPQCRRAIAIRGVSDDPSDEVVLAEELTLSCLHCGRRDLYRPFDVRRIQAPEGR
jgi:hypothetical protein